MGIQIMSQPMRLLDISSWLTINQSQQELQMHLGINQCKTRMLEEWQETANQKAAHKYFLVIIWKVNQGQNPGQQTENLKEREVN